MIFLFPFDIMKQRSGYDQVEIKINGDVPELTLICLNSISQSFLSFSNQLQMGF